MPDNLLIISGRQNAVLNAGGGKMAAEKVEAALVSFKGVNEAAVCMATNKLGVEEVWAAIVCGEKIGSERLRTLPAAHADGVRAGAYRDPRRAAGNCHGQGRPPTPQADAHGRRCAFLTGLLNQTTAWRGAGA